ncbi:hypothetical protein Prum_024680 [Phytohabitans rumicis]|uniref:Lipoprotein n=1 Tax=Phytohabitans rumicis TaxID=1076125 RepID=A0A6V8L3W8_9ACTN|nr:hypothetical protein Prum_024680 [Phytohabitans rumicis]
MVSSVVVALGVVGASVAVGAVPAMAAGKKVCTIQDERLDELSGLIATKTGYITINDSTDSSSRKRVFYLTSKCGISKNVPYSGNGPRDTEDLAISPDAKTLWIADVGDNPDSNPRRTNVALWSMPVGGGSEPVIHRVAYPDGKAHDAEALLIGANNVPVIITKTAGKAELYSPAAALKKNNETPVALAKVGEVTLPKTETENVFGAPGRLLVTGAARSPDGTKVVLRTYADAFEFDVTGGDIVKAITTGKPRITPLETDQFGEAIAYSADGKSFLTVSDLGTLDEDIKNDLLRYTPSVAAPQATKAASIGGGANGGGSDRSWLDDITLQQITYLIGGVGLLGALLVGAGVFGILRARRRPPAAPVGAKAGQDDTPSPTVGRQPVPGAAVAAVAVEDRYGGYDDASWDRRPGGFDDGYRSEQPAPNDYQPAGQAYGAPARPPAGNVYGGGVNGGNSGNVYGGGQYHQPPPPEAPPAGGTYSGGVYGRPQAGPSGVYPDEY